MTCLKNLFFNLVFGFVIGLVLVAFGVKPAMAAGTVRKTPVVSHAITHESSSAEGGHQHTFSGLLGFYGMGATNYQAKVGSTESNLTPVPLSGLFGLGLDYEYLWKEHITFGGLFRYYSTSDSSTNGTPAVITDNKTSVMSLGGIVRTYMDSEDFKFFVGTGLGILSVSYTSGTNSYDIPMGFGFYLDAGALYKVNDQLSIGVETLRALAVGEKINGTPIVDYMIKGRYSL